MSYSNIGINKRLLFHSKIRLIALDYYIDLILLTIHNSKRNKNDQ